MPTNGFKDKLITVWGLTKKYAKKVWEYVKIAKMELIVMIALFAIDLLSNSLNFTYVRNYDAAFGSDFLRTHLGIGARILFCIFAVVASVVFVIILVKNRGGHKLVRIGLGMLVAGAMGNCIDRMALGYVRDFIEFVYFGGTIFGRSSFWIFNIADAALVIGVILVVIYYLFIYKSKDEADKNKALEAPASEQPESTASEQSEIGENADAGDVVEDTDGDNMSVDAESGGAKAEEKNVSADEEKEE